MTCFTQFKNYHQGGSRFDIIAGLIRAAVEIKLRTSTQKGEANET